VNDLVKSGNGTVKILKCNGKWFWNDIQRRSIPIVMAGIQDLIVKGEYPDNLWK